MSQCPHCYWPLFTPREAELLALACEGMTTREIAERMFITEHTAKNMLWQLYKKTEVHSREALMVKAFAHGYAPLPEQHPLRRQ